MTWIRLCRRSISTEHGPAKLFDINAATATAPSTDGPAAAGASQRMMAERLMGLPISGRGGRRCYATGVKGRAPQVIDPARVRRGSSRLARSGCPSLPDPTRSSAAHLTPAPSLRHIFSRLMRLAACALYGYGERITAFQRAFARTNGSASQVPDILFRSSKGANSLGYHHLLGSRHHCTQFSDCPRVPPLRRCAGLGAMSDITMMPLPASSSLISVPLPA